MSRSALVFFLVAGCADFVPDVGEPLVERCVNEDSDPSTPVLFGRDIQAGIIQAINRCLPCHKPGGDNALGFEIGGLDLTTFSGVRAGGTNGPGVVIPGRPCDSILMQKLSAGPPFGSRMPLNGPPFLGPDELVLVHDWIAEGALDN